MTTFAVGKSHHFGRTIHSDDFREENLKAEGKTELGKVPLNTEMARKVLLPLHSLGRGATILSPAHYQSGQSGQRETWLGNGLCHFQHNEPLFL